MWKDLIDSHQLIKGLDVEEEPSFASKDIKDGRGKPRLDPALILAP